MLTVGQPVPEFALPNQDGQTTRLSDFRGKKLVLFSFPKADSLGCNMQACSFRDEYTLLTDKDVAVLGISADTIDELKRWKQNKRLPYDLLSDREHKTLEQYGAWGLDVLSLIKLPVVKRHSWVIDENGLLIAESAILNPNDNVAWAIRMIEERARAQA